MDTEERGTDAMHTKREKLITARARKNWTLNQAAEQIGCAPNTLNRWELGAIAPSAYYRERLCIAYGMTAEQLGLVEETSSFAENVSQVYVNANLTTRLLSLISTSQCSPSELQHTLEQSIDEFIRTHPGKEQKLQDALHVVAMLPMTHEGALPTEVILHQCVAGITACGHLSNGSLEDMQLASAMIAAYLPLLHTISRESPRSRKAVAGFIAQALQIQSRLSGLLESIELGIRYGEEAIKYARESGNRVLLAMLLRGQFADYEFGMVEHPERRKKAAQVVEEMHTLLEQKQGVTIPSFIQSWAYTGLAKYQALCSREQEMLTSLSKAEETFSESPDKNRIPGNINHSHAQLFRHKAITYAYFGKQDQAFKIFQEKLIDINDTYFASKLPLAARNRLGVLSELTFTTLYLPKAMKDKELSIALWKAKVAETLALRSESYFDEARIAYSVMKGIWSDDAAIRELRDLLVHW